MLVVPPARDLLRERSASPAFAQPLPRATGVRGDSSAFSSTSSGGDLVRFLLAPWNRDEALYLLSGKSLFYFLSDRPSPVAAIEFSLYLVAFDLIDKTRIANVIDEAALVEALRRTRPLIVDDHHDEQARNAGAPTPTSQAQVPRQVRSTRST